MTLISMYVKLLLLSLFFDVASAGCPNACTCRDGDTRVDCTAKGLQKVPAGFPKQTKIL